MAKRKPCPDPRTHTWVETADGKGYWRHKRGTLKKAKLNAALQRNANLTGPANQAARRILARLGQYTQHLRMGRFYSRLAGALKKGVNRAGKTSYAFLDGLEFQADHPVSQLIAAGYHVERSGDSVELTIGIWENNIKKIRTIVTHYWFDLVLLHGDAFKEGHLRIDADTSQVYACGVAAPDCVLRVHPPRTPWIVLLRVSCIETPTAAQPVEIAKSAANHAMKIVAVG